MTKFESGEEVYGHENLIESCLDDMSIICIFNSVQPKIIEMKIDYLKQLSIHLS